MNNPTQPDESSRPLTPMKVIIKWAGHTEGSVLLENAYSTRIDVEIAADYIMRFPPNPCDQEK